MHTLMPYEKRWIAKRLKTYRIKYAEIYNEVYDHLVSACEYKRKSGDNRPILPLFEEIMKQDIGDQRGISDMTAERKQLLKTQLQTGLKATFNSYFNSGKSAVMAVVALAIYLFAKNAGLDPAWLMLAIMCLSLAPLFYFLGIGTGNGYFRTVTSRRKTSLVNTLMLHISFVPYSGIVSGFFSSAVFSTLFGNEPAGSSLSRAIIQFLGHPGLSVILTLVIAYTVAFVKIANTDYKRLIAHV
ncbi:hypothetical protein SAMN05421747_1317 [Parapedobacter composti]|uniref:Uncharacterized protein n=1 Tax=Parapedobacter composti TaxID=623281 RepID=A0A1I1M9C0_9SPHI|nr:hypothetical protein [Parapedobacter composti]SFC82011.1 hypothetical protein SAMN05421747_1317 [Parapedobacter composti]